MGQDCCSGTEDKFPNSSDTQRLPYLFSNVIRSEVTLPRIVAGTNIPCSASNRPERYIGGGRSYDRRVLSMSTLAAIRHKEKGNIVLSSLCLENHSGSGTGPRARLTHALNQRYSKKIFESAIANY